jgi:hypothetical protein
VELPDAAFHSIQGLQASSNTGKRDMAGNTQSPSERNTAKKETWLADVLLPVLFTVVLASCMAQLGYSVLQNMTSIPLETDYANPAFAS